MTAKLLSVEDAIGQVLAGVRPLLAQSTPIFAAHRRVLAEDVSALRTQPPDDLSAMDGYAVRAADVVDVPAELKIVGEVAAGRPFAGTLEKGQAARIFTGGVVPPGADTIVIQENTNRDKDIVRVLQPAESGKHIRRAGLDFAAGNVLLKQGRRLTARDLMLAASMNHPTISVHCAPRVAILATGDELIAPGGDPGPGEIIYSNGFALRALAESEGAEVTDLGIVPDRIDATVDAIRRARSANVDVLVTTGGASVGDYDLVQKALSAEGLALSFWKVALRPGRPMMHGRLGAMHVLGLPGNPVSAFVCGVLFLLPLLRSLSGRSDIHAPQELAALGKPLKENDERADYMRARIVTTPEGERVIPLPMQDSSMIAALATCDALLVRPAHEPAKSVGDPCTIIRLTGGQ